MNITIDWPCPVCGEASWRVTEVESEARPTLDWVAAENRHEPSGPPTIKIEAFCTLHDAPYREE